jgi:hypothetical protein
MSFDDIKPEVERFLSTKPLEAENSFGQKHFEHIAAQELSDTSDVLYTDDLHYTSEMQGQIIKPHRDKLVNWRNLSSNFVQKLQNVISDNSAVKANEELGKLNREKEEAIEERRVIFTRENKYTDAKRDKEASEERYQRMLKDNGGKPPESMAIWLYIPALFFVGLVEAFLNYSTFDAQFDAPALALGMTLIIALTFAFASHFHGGFLKQRYELMGRDVEKRQRQHTLIIQVVVTVFFILVFTGLMMVRYQVIQLELADSPMMMNSLPSAGLPGQTVDNGEPSVLELLLPTLLFNLGVWFLGTFISFWMHDAKPLFKEAKKDSDKASKSFSNLENLLHEEYTQVEAKFTKQSNELKNRIEAEIEIANKAEQLNQRLKEEHDKITGATLIRINEGARKYRNILITKAKQSGKTDLKVGAQLMSLDAYLQSNINLSLDVFEKSLVA